MRGKIIVIEGTDCSGKETQSKLLEKKLNECGKKTKRISFPMYDTSTGKIIGSCLLGKQEMCKQMLRTEHSFFEEGGGNIDALTAIMYYAADRRYNLPIINKYLDEGYNLIIDRYVPSNMAHRGGLVLNSEERKKLYEKIDTLEYVINELPRPDKIILLYLSYKKACELKKNRDELPDEVENNVEYLKRSEKAYLELSDIYNYDIIKCEKNEKIRDIEDINKELYEKVISIL